MNTYFLEDIIVVEDGIFMPAIQPLMDKYPWFRWYFTGSTVGELMTLDTIYKKIKSKWIFHADANWVFMKPGFIEASLKYMN